MVRWWLALRSVFTVGMGGGEGKVSGKSRDVGDHHTGLLTVRWWRWHFRMVDGDDLGVFL
jgi:hypothetical protein